MTAQRMRELSAAGHHWAESLENTNGGQQPAVDGERPREVN